MRLWSKVRAVAWFEFISTVRRKGYLIATFGMPLFLAAYGSVISYGGRMMEAGSGGVRSFAVVDDAGLLDLEGGRLVSLVELPPEARRVVGLASKDVKDLMERGDAIFEPFGGMEEARSALLADQVAGVYRIPSDYLATGTVDSLTLSRASLMAGDASDQFERLLRDAILMRSVPGDVRERIETPVVKRNVMVLNDDGSATERDLVSQILRIAVPAVFGLMLFISLMMTTGYLLQATAAEKENKVVEVLLSSVDPEEILLGKLLGLGAAGLLQVGVWFSMLVVGSVIAATVMAVVGFALPWKSILVGMPYFLATYFFLGSLILASGSLGGNLKESQQMSVIWTLLPVTPLIFIGVLITQPHGILAKVLSWLPFTSAMAQQIRLVVAPEGVGWFEIVGGFVVLLLSTWLAISFGARFYRIGLLMTGARPKLREILRQARLKA
jgi:ABC-2 type transport system permease protein